MVTTIAGLQVSAPPSRPKGSIVTDDLDFSFGRLEYGLKSAGTFVFAIEQHTSNQFLGAGRKLHWSMRVADSNAAAEKCTSAVLHVLHLLEMTDEVGANEPYCLPCVVSRVPAPSGVEGGPTQRGWLRFRCHCSPGCPAKTLSV